MPAFLIGACGAASTGGGARGKTGDGVKTLLISSRLEYIPANETIMLITLSHCVVVRTFLVGGSVLGGGSVDGASGVSACFRSFFATMLCASIRAFFCASRACLVLWATSLPAATRFGFFCFVAGVCEVTCSASAIYLLNKLYLIAE